MTYDSILFYKVLGSSINQILLEFYCRLERTTILQPMFSEPVYIGAIFHSAIGNS